jgi:hypothetical protein
LRAAPWRPVVPDDGSVREAARQIRREQREAAVARERERREKRDEHRDKEVRRGRA